TKVLGGDGEDRGLSVALRQGQVFLAGTTQGLRHRVADQDGFVAGFDLRGRPAWSYALGDRTPTRSRRSSRAPRASISRGGPRGRSRTSCPPGGSPRGSASSWTGPVGGPRNSGGGP